MAAGSVVLYNSFETQLAQAGHNLASDTIVATLIGTGYTPQVPTDAQWSAASANEITGTGYTAGGVALTSQALTFYASSASGSAIVAGGSGYAASSTFNVTVVGGTSTTAAVLSVTTNGSGVVTTINSITTAGNYTVLPSNPAATTGGTGTGLTIAVKWGLTFNAAAVTWSSATMTAKYCLLVRRASGALASTDRLIGYVDLNTSGGTLASTAGTFQVSWATASGATPAGLFQVS